MIESCILLSQPEGGDNNDRFSGRGCRKTHQAVAPPEAGPLPDRLYGQLKTMILCPEGTYSAFCCILGLPRSGGLNIPGFRILWQRAEKSREAFYRPHGCGTPEGTRTPNIQNRNLTLYPLNYGCFLILDYYSRSGPESKAILKIFSLLYGQNTGRTGPRRPCGSRGPVRKLSVVFPATGGKHNRSCRLKTNVKGYYVPVFGHSDGAGDYRRLFQSAALLPAASSSSAACRNLSKFELQA